MTTEVEKFMVRKKQEDNKQFVKNITTKDHEKINAT